MYNDKSGLVCSDHFARKVIKVGNFHDSCASTIDHLVPFLDLLGGRRAAASETAEQDEWGKYANEFGRFHKAVTRLRSIPIDAFSFKHPFGPRQPFVFVGSQPLQITRISSPFGSNAIGGNARNAALIKHQNEPTASAFAQCPDFIHAKVETDPVRYPGSKTDGGDNRNGLFPTSAAEFAVLFGDEFINFVGPTYEISRN
jgi:hypothetical protein